MSRVWGAFIAVLLCVVMLPSTVAAGNSQYFPETGQTSSNAFYEFWQTHGGLEILGMPLSPVYQRERENRIIQIYERVVLEWHPENTRANRVQIERLGDLYLSRLRDTQTKVNTGDMQRHSPPRACGTTSDCETFDTTNHTLLGAFRDYWYANGGLTAFGLPLTEEYEACGTDDGNCTGHFSAQFFERSAFEWHPEVNGGTVLLRRLGALTWDDETRTSIARNPGFLRSIPDYDDVKAMNTAPPAPANIPSPPPPSSSLAASDYQASKV